MAESGGRRPASMPRRSARARLKATRLMPGRNAMRLLSRFIALFVLALLCTPARAQDGKIVIEKFNHSEWTKGIFSEAVTVTGIGNAKLIYLAGVGAEDETGAR